MNNLGGAILSIITNGEGQDVEFKSKAHAVGETICSFANTNGGIILVGVSDNGKIVGCHKKHEQVTANIAHTCKPSIYPLIDPLEIDGKNVFVVKVKKSSQIHSFKNIAYIRVGTHDKPLSAEELIEKRGRGPGTHYILASFGEFWRDKMRASKGGGIWL